MMAVTYVRGKSIILSLWEAGFCCVNPGKSLPASATLCGKVRVTTEVL